MGRTGKREFTTGLEKLRRVPLGKKKSSSRKQAPLGRPILPERLWPLMPEWIALHAERGPHRKCWNGCRLLRDKQDGRRFKHCEMRGCGVTPAAGEPVMACRKCKWMVCQVCAKRKRIPTLAKDPLFHGPRSPCLLEPPHFAQQAASGCGTVIIVPGGNYEFLSALEGQPVVDWLAEHGIDSCILRYRLLPSFGAC